MYVADAYNHRIQVFAQNINTPPNTTITSAIDGNGAQVQNGGSTSSNRITFQFTASGGTPPITFECSLDNSSFSSCASIITYSKLNTGYDHTFAVRALDTSGNKDSTPASFSWRVLTPTEAKGISIPTSTTQQTDCETGGTHSAISAFCNNNSTNTIANSGGFKISP